MTKLENKSETRPQDKGIKLRNVQVHQAATIKNATESTFRADKGYSMYYTPAGVFVEYKDISFIIPLANVVLALIE